MRYHDGDPTSGPAYEILIELEKNSPMPLRKIQRLLELTEGATRILLSQLKASGLVMRLTDVEDLFPGQPIKDLLSAQEYFKLTKVLNEDEAYGLTSRGRLFLSCPVSPMAELEQEEVVDGLWVED